MPLVFAMNELSESDISYEDVPYVSYEYPTSYRKRIQVGVPFVYYRGRRKSAGGRQMPAYLGTGIVGDIRVSAIEGRLVCEVVDGRPFQRPVPFKDGHDQYLEPEGARPGYYVPGVRPISDEAFAEILSRAEATDSPSGPRPDPDELPPPPRSSRNSLYAKPEVAREVERRSREIAIGHLESLHPGCAVWELPTNNPGFDLETDVPGTRFVEVKGTQAGFPRFAMSEGERRFAEANRDDYMLSVVFGIDLGAGTHLGIETARAPLGASHGLEPIQWAGALGGGGTRIARIDTSRRGAVPDVPC
jgi:Protein NO VEIN, C-terminal